MRDAAIALGVLILACGCPASKPTKNPLDLWSGRYQSAKLEVELELDGASYTGTVVKQGERYPLTAKPAGTDELEGQFTVGEESFACTLHMTKQGLDFTTGSSTYVLTEVRAPANPLDSGGDPSAPANPLDAGGGSTPDPSPAPPNPLAGGKDPATPARDPSIAEAGEPEVVNPWGAGWVDFKHASGISFRHPGDWRAQEIQGGITLTPPDAAQDPQGNPLEVYLVNADLANGVSDPAGAEARAFVHQEIDPQFPALKSKGAPERRELRGRTIGVYAWSGTSPQNGLALEARLFCAIEGQYAYFLFALGENGRVAKRSPQLEAVVASFGYSAPPKDERLSGYWRYTHSQVSGSFSMVTDYHLQLDADGSARWKTQSGGGDANSSVMSGDGGWTKTGRWRTEGKQLFVDWSDGTQLAAPYICDGSSLLLKRSSGKQIYERVR